jgi:hypothetical protein
MGGAITKILVPLLLFSNAALAVEAAAVTAIDILHPAVCFEVRST